MILIVIVILLLIMIVILVVIVTMIVIGISVSYKFKSIMGDVLMVEADIEMCFGYGMFGYGYSNQLLNVGKPITEGTFSPNLRKQKPVRYITAHSNLTLRRLAFYMI